MRILKLMVGTAIISSLTPYTGHAMQEVSKEQTAEIQCPKLTKQFILQNRDDFPFPFQHRGGDIHWEGKTWEIWNATSHVNVNHIGKKTPISHFALQTRGFVDAATQDGIQVTMDGPHYSPTGTGHKVLCLYQYHHLDSESIEASVQLIHEVSAEAPQYVQSFIHDFKYTPLT